MNLYEIRFRHFSPKDSNSGIICLLVASGDEQVYDWFRSDPEVPDLEMSDRSKITRLFSGFDSAEVDEDIDDEEDCTCGEDEDCESCQLDSLDDVKLKRFDIYDSEYNVIGTETFRERTVRLKGTMFDEDAEVENAHYGVTHYGWVEVKKDVSSADLVLLKSIGVSVLEAPAVTNT